MMPMEFYTQYFVEPSDDHIPGDHLALRLLLTGHCPAQGPHHLLTEHWGPPGKQFNHHHHLNYVIYCREFVPIEIENGKILINPQDWPIVYTMSYSQFCTLSRQVCSGEPVSGHVQSRVFTPALAPVDHRAVLPLREGLLNVGQRVDPPGDHAAGPTQYTAGRCQIVERYNFLLRVAEKNPLRKTILCQLPWTKGCTSACKGEKHLCESWIDWTSRLARTLSLLWTIR